MDDRAEERAYESTAEEELYEKLNARIKRRNRFILITAITIAAIIVCGALYFGLRSFFGVEEITVNAGAAPGSEEILSASGIRKGQIIFLVSKKDAEKAILDRYPSLQSVSVKTELPRRVVITVVDESPSYYFSTGSTPAFAVVSKSEKVLDFFDSEEALKNAYPDVLYVIVPPVRTAVKGATTVYFDEADGGYLPGLIDWVRACDFGSEPVLLDASSRFDLKVCFGGTAGSERIRLLLGNRQKMQEKLAFAQGIYTSLGQEFTGVISVEDPKNGYARKMNEIVPTEDD